jgi:hypothetical protein
MKTYTAEEMSEAYERLRRTEKVLALTLTAIQFDLKARQLATAPVGSPAWDVIAKAASIREKRKVHPPTSEESRTMILARLRSHESTQRQLGVEVVLRPINRRERTGKSKAGLRAVA